jgi:hypothetical protein
MSAIDPLPTLRRPAIPTGFGSTQMKVARRADFWFGLGTVMVFVAVVLATSIGKAAAAAGSFAAITAVLQTKWESRHHRWFWIVSAIFALIHLLAIVLVTFPEPRLGIVVIPFIMVDGAAMWGILSCVERYFSRTNRQPPD